MRRLDYTTLALTLLISYGCVVWLLSLLIQVIVGTPEPGETRYSGALWVLMPAYFCVPPLLAGCLVARAANNRPMLHALIAAVAGAALYAAQSSSAWLALLPLILTGTSAGIYLRIASQRA